MTFTIKTNTNLNKQSHHAYNEKQDYIYNYPTSQEEEMELGKPCPVLNRMQSTESLK